jgi:hypothetical protein
VQRIDYAGSVHDQEEIDAVVEVLRGLILPSNHSLDDADVDYIWEAADAFLAKEGLDR